jgi:hypothetical protein
MVHGSTQESLFHASVELEDANFFDMPVTSYSLVSGRRKRRVDAAVLNDIVDQVLRQVDTVTGRLQVVLERPTPIPDVDGWQSAAVSGVLSARAAQFWVLACSLLALMPIEQP